MFGSVGKTWSTENIYNQRGKKKLETKEDNLLFSRDENILRNHLFSYIPNTKRSFSRKFYLK